MSEFLDNRDSALRLLREFVGPVEIRRYPAQHPEYALSFALNGTVTVVRGHTASEAIDYALGTIGIKHRLL